MATHIRQLISADGWYAVYARVGSAARPGPARPSGVGHAGGPVPEFLPLVAWALVGDDVPRQAERVVGIVVHENHHPEQVDPDDPGFLGYAGPGDPSTPRDRLAPDWRALARRAITDLRQAQ